MQTREYRRLESFLPLWKEQEARARRDGFAATVENSRRAIRSILAALREERK